MLLTGQQIYSMYLLVARRHNVANGLLSWHLMQQTGRVVMNDLAYELNKELLATKTNPVVDITQSAFATLIRIDAYDSPELRTNADPDLKQEDPT